MYASSFAHRAVSTGFSPSFAVRARPDAPLSPAAVGPYTRGIHEDMLAAYGQPFDGARFESAVGSTYLDFYRLLLGRATNAGLRLPPLLVAGHAVPDLRLEETPTVRMIGEFEGPVSTFAVMEETSLVALLALHSAIVAARSQRYDSFAFILADRADLVYPVPGQGSARIEEAGVLVRFDLADGSEHGASHRIRWRFGLATREAVVAAADELAASATGTIVVSAELAAQWDGLGDRGLGDGVQVAPANQPATGLFDIALDQPAGSEPMLIGFDPQRGQLAALSFRVPEVIL